MTLSSSVHGGSPEDGEPHPSAVVVMGVAGCGKSTLAAALAHLAAVPFLEGDDFHSTANLEKMRKGVALDDADRAGWLDDIARRLCEEPRGAVVSCSALRRSYRDRLRRAVPGLRFVYLKVDESLAKARVASRGPDHVFPAALVASQFAALEEPAAESDVLELDGSAPPASLAAQALAWLPTSSRPARSAEELENADDAGASSR